MSCYFITGIDTDIGKSYMTGLMGRSLLRAGADVTTMKLVQTGCEELSEDIVTHRRIMGIELTELDREGVTCPYLYRFPASPHLASAMEGEMIDPARLDEACLKVSSRYETVLLEGAGGLYVPLTEEYTILDLLNEKKYPTIVVTSPRLGSINHTMLTIEALRSRNIPLAGLVYNLGVGEVAEISKDTRRLLEKMVPGTPIIDVPRFVIDSPPELDLTPLFR